jgi:hypothetical protein
MMARRGRTGTIGGKTSEIIVHEVGKLSALKQWLVISDQWSEKRWLG